MPKRLGLRRWTAGSLAVILVAGIAIAAWLATSGSSTSYRTAAARRGNVKQVLTTTGELGPVHYSDAEFQVAGTVAKVRAVVGRKVVAGQTLARLDRSSLRAALSAARSSLAQARTRLNEDKTSEVSTASFTSDASGASGEFDAAHPTVVTSATPHPSGSPSPSGSPNPTGSGFPRGGSHGSADPAQIKRDQAAVLAAQHATDTALTAARTALASERAACAAELSGSKATTPSASPSPTPTPSSGLTCAQATAGLLHDQTVVNIDEGSVDRSEQTLAADLMAALKAVAKQQKSGSTTTHSHGAGSSQTSVTASAADLATDQASIDEARSAVATAKENLRQATLTAAISGRIAAVTISKGDAVSTGSSSTEPAVEIIGSRQDKATVYLSDTQVRSVALGMPAQVTPDGSGRALRGRVVDVGAAGTESESGSVSYPVTVDIAASAGRVVAGADAAVSITLATAHDVIAVPTSAVQYSGSAAYVDTVSAGRLTRHDVKISAIGPALTEVVSGVTSGEQVVLADLDAAVPSSNTTLTPTRATFRFAGGGGFQPPG